MGKKKLKILVKIIKIGDLAVIMTPFDIYIFFILLVLVTSIESGHVTSLM